MLRRKFLNTLTSVVALVTAQDLMAKSKPIVNENDKNSDELILTVEMRKIGKDTISSEEKKLIKELNLRFLSSGQLVSITKKPSEIKSNSHSGLRSICTFRSKSDKADYIKQKEILFNSFKNSKKKSEA
jgi:hypothetical protein